MLPISVRMSGRRLRPGAKDPGGLSGCNGSGANRGSWAIHLPWAVLGNRKNFLMRRAITSECEDRSVEQAVRLHLGVLETVRALSRLFLMRL